MQGNRIQVNDTFTISNLIIRCMMRTVVLDTDNTRCVLSPSTLHLTEQCHSHDYLSCYVIIVHVLFIVYYYLINFYIACIDVYNHSL